MKNAFSLKNNLNILFLFLSVVLFGQEHSLNFQVKQGMTGFDIKEPDYSSYDKIIGEDFSIGLNYRFSFFTKKYFIGGVGILWNYNSFAQRRIDQTNFFMNPFGPPNREYERTQRFQSHAIVFPVTIRTQIRKIGFSFGLIPRYHLSNKLYFEEVTEVINAPLEYDLLKIDFVAGETITDVPLSQGRGARTFLKDDVDIQFIFGLDIYLNSRFIFELEYKDLIHDNYLQVLSDDQYGYWRAFSGKHEFSLETISIGINWQLL